MVILKIKTIDSDEFEMVDTLSFSFKKNVYMPYTHLNVTFTADDFSYFSISEVKLIVNEIEVHHGLIDSIDIFEENGVKKGHIISRGFTSLLCQNHLETGLISNISLNILMDSYYTLPYVTHEDNSDSQNYINVLSNSTMWDGIVTLAYKLYGCYPYVIGTNCVKISEKSNALSFSYDENSLVSYGVIYNYSSLISNFYMADISGLYEQYQLEDSNVIDRQIVRHKYFDLDKEYLSNPQDGLDFRRNVTNKAYFGSYCKYNGYNGEDLHDTISFQSVESEKIAFVEIIGSENGIFTKIGVYNDYFMG